MEPEGLALLAEQAMVDIAHLLRPAHLKQLASILKDPEASKNDRFVALELLKNANVAAGMVLPSCQDTGTGMHFPMSPPPPPPPQKGAVFIHDEFDFCVCWSSDSLHYPAIVMGKRGQYVLTDGNDEEALSRGVFKTYTETNLRYSQVAPLDMYTEKNTGTNLPAQVH